MSASHGGPTRKSERGELGARIEYIESANERRRRIAFALESCRQLALESVIPL